MPSCDVKCVFVCVGVFRTRILCGWITTRTSMTSLSTPWTHMWLSFLTLRSEHFCFYSAVIFRSLIFEVILNIYLASLYWRVHDKTNQWSLLWIISTNVSVAAEHPNSATGPYRQAGQEDGGLWQRPPSLRLLTERQKERWGQDRQGNGGLCVLVCCFWSTAHDGVLMPKP